MLLNSVRLRAATLMVAAALGPAARANAGTPPPVPVQWTNLVKATATGVALQKTGTCGSCTDAGATSAQTVQNADGYVEFVPGTGARAWIGLGGTATADTNPALIDFAFSFWPDGGWDIREKTVYRTEGRFVAGDVFRVALVAGRVKYYKNGALVYSSAMVPTLPLVLDVTLMSVTARVVSATITPDPTPPPPPPPPPPPIFDALTDRVVRPKGPTPAIGGAGSVFPDPDYGTRLARLTDGTTRPAAIDRSYRTPSGVHSNAWSSDGRYFYTVSTDGTLIPFAFDPVTMAATRLTPTTTGNGGLTMLFRNEPTFSYVTPGVLYGTYSGSAAAPRTVDQFDLATSKYTQLLNLDTVVPGLTGVVGSVLVSAAPERLVTFFGGTSQDRHNYLLVFDKANPANRHLVDTVASTVDGTITDVPLNFRIHAASIDRSGRYVIAYPTAADMAAPRSAAPVYVWDLTVNQFTALPLSKAHTGGHDAYGYGVRVNQDCCSSSTWDAAQWQFRSLANPLLTFDLIAPVVLPKEVFLADHPSWHNAKPDRLVPFVEANYRYGTNTTPWRPWDEEILGVQTDAPGTGGTVWRFAHHRSVVANDLDPSRIYFWYTPRPNVSQDGRWALFTSNWDKTLGTDPRGETGGKARQDVFVVELQRLR